MGGGASGAVHDVDLAVGSAFVCRDEAVQDGVGVISGPQEVKAARAIEGIDKGLRRNRSDPCREVRHALDLGLDIAVCQTSRDFKGMAEPHRTTAFGRAERKFDTMAGSAAIS